jgi:hypothetical protein
MDSEKKNVYIIKLNMDNRAAGLLVKTVEGL